MKIAVVISDARMKEVYRQLKKRYDVIPLSKTEDFSIGLQLDVLVLPVKGMDDDGNLRLKDKTILIPSDFWKHLPADGKIFCGLPHPFFKSLTQTVHYYMKEEDVLKKNAVLTAEGILFLLIDNTSQSIQKLNVDIIGYGRCGKEFAGWLNALKIPYRIIRREDQGLPNMISVQDWLLTEPYDVIVNTSIQPIIDAACINQWHRKPLIIDIATPYVIDGDYAISKGIKFIKAGNLPALIAYQTAGELVADYVKETIENGK